MARQRQVAFLLLVAFVAVMAALMMVPSPVTAEESVSEPAGERVEVKSEEVEVETEGSEAETEKGYEDWHFLFYLPGWVPGLDGDVTARGIKAPLDITIGDSFEDLKYLEALALGHFEVKKGRWGFLLEIVYMELEEQENFARDIKIPIVVPPIEIPVSGDIRVTSTTSWDEAAVLYEVYRSASSKGNQPVVAVEALAGARYTYLESQVEATFTGPLGNTLHIDEKADKDWVDPILGGRVFWNLTDRWMLGFRGDLGGFGLTSNIGVNLDAMARYRITKWLNAYAGFRGLYQDHEEGSGNDKFKWKAWVYGPWMGLGVEF